MHEWSPVVVLGNPNTTDGHDHHTKITTQTHCFPFLKMWLQVNPWEIPVTAMRENREMLQVVCSYELYIKNVYIFSFVQGAEMKLQFHFGTAVPALRAPLQLPRGALSSSVSELHFATLWGGCTVWGKQLLPSQAIPNPAVSNTEMSEGPSASSEELLASLARNSIFYLLACPQEAVSPPQGQQGAWTSGLSDQLSVDLDICIL